MPEPLLFVIPTYGIVCFWMVVLINVVMRKARQRRPQIGTAGLLGVAMERADLRLPFTLAIIDGPHRAKWPTS